MIKERKKEQLAAIIAKSVDADADAAARSLSS